VSAVNGGVGAPVELHAITSGTEIRTRVRAWVRYDRSVETVSVSPSTVVRITSAMLGCASTVTACGWPTVTATSVEPFTTMLRNGATNALTGDVALSDDGPEPAAGAGEVWHRGEDQHDGDQRNAAATTASARRSANVVSYLFRPPGAGGFTQGTARPSAVFRVASSLGPLTSSDSTNETIDRGWRQEGHSSRRS